jgi:thiosulfate dehydrogenase (quinone) large subunit
MTCEPARPGNPCQSSTRPLTCPKTVVLTVTRVTSTFRSHGSPRRLWTSGWTLLPLRLFLGATFVYAGLQKLADPNFLDASAPNSIQAQLQAATRSSPIGGLLGGLVHHASLVGVVIALAELAVGVGTLLGLWTRGAAAGGLALSIGFLLTVSWHSHPYYLGPDIVFAAAWAPLLLAGAGDDPRLSLDALLRHRTSTAMGLPSARTVPVAFAAVQRLCGGYENDRCRYRRGQPCGPEQCPVLRTPAIQDNASAENLDRRTLLRRAQLAGVLVVGGAVTAAITAGIGRVLAGGGGGDPVAALPSAGHHRPTGSTSSHDSTGTNDAGGGTPTTTDPSTESSGTTATPTPSGVPIGPASAVPVGGVAAFSDPTTGESAYVVQPAAGRFAAFSSVCPHAGCQVQYSRSTDEFICPCHGARFDGTGNLLQGPAQRSLDAIAVTAGADGQLYVDG